VLADLQRYVTIEACRFLLGESLRSRPGKTLEGLLVSWDVAYVERSGRNSETVEARYGNSARRDSVKGSWKTCCPTLMSV